MPLTISLHRSNEVSIQEQVYVREIGGGSSVHHHLIQYLQICGREEKKTKRKKKQKTQFTHQTIFNLPQPPCLLIWCHPLAPHCWICASTNICQKPLTSYVRSELHFANDSVCSCRSLNSRLTACRRLLWRRPSQDEQTALASRFDLFLARAEAARGAGPCSYVTKTFIGEPEALTYRGQSSVNLHSAAGTVWMSMSQCEVDTLPDTAWLCGYFQCPRWSKWSPFRPPWTSFPSSLWAPALSSDFLRQWQRYLQSVQML